jgi:hypothetical protein
MIRGVRLDVKRPNVLFTCCRYVGLLGLLSKRAAVSTPLNCVLVEGVVGFGSELQAGRFLDREML